MTTAISVSGLHKSFGRTRALDGLDLTVQTSEVHGFLGPNGAGKTTTLRILLGLFGNLLQLDQWMLDLSPFTHIPKLPGGEISAEPLVWLVSVAAVLTMAGFVGFRRRDLG